MRVVIDLLDAVEAVSTLSRVHKEAPVVIESPADSRAVLFSCLGCEPIELQAECKSGAHHVCRLTRIHLVQALQGLSMMGDNALSLRFQKDGFVHLSSGHHGIHVVDTLQSKPSLNVVLKAHNEALAESAAFDIRARTREIERIRAKRIAADEADARDEHAVWLRARRQTGRPNADNKAGRRRQVDLEGGYRLDTLCAKALHDSLIRVGQHAGHNGSLALVHLDLGNAAVMARNGERACVAALPGALPRYSASLHADHIANAVLPWLAKRARVRFEVRNDALCLTDGEDSLALKRQPVGVPLWRPMFSPPRSDNALRLAGAEFRQAVESLQCSDTVQLERFGDVLTLRCLDNSKRPRSVSCTGVTSVSAPIHVRGHNLLRVVHGIDRDTLTLSVPIRADTPLLLFTSRVSFAIATVKQE